MTDCGNSWTTDCGDVMQSRWAAECVEVLQFVEQIKGPPGRDGIDGDTIGRWLFGAGVPSNAIGVDGQAYFDNVNLEIYQKIAGAWVLQSSLQAPPPTYVFGGVAQVVEAASVLGGQRAVWLDAAGQAHYADQSDVSQPLRVLGITLTAVPALGNVQVQTYGRLEEPSWNWVPGDEIFLAVNGLLTQTPPLTGFNLVLGFALSPTKMFIDIGEPILLLN